MKIIVTRKDIENGNRHHGNDCPVGLAIKRAGVVHCCVTETAVVVRDEHKRVSALLLPDPVQRWISDYDQAKPVEPISFELGLPLSVRINGHHSPATLRNGHAGSNGHAHPRRLSPRAAAAENW
jgi:hypothetical protein